MSQPLEQIQIRDPFVLTLPESRDYLLFGSTDKNIWSGPATGFDCYRSTDLETWEGPHPAFRPAADFWSKEQYWAPEVHEYQGRYFMFATFTAPGHVRGTQILSAAKPEGPYEPWSAGPVTPGDWECLDGTLHVDKEGTPWMVFCHEWKQVHDGAVAAQRLSPDLRAAEGDPVFLFSASEAPWSRALDVPSVKDREFPVYVTDGPFLFRLASGKLIMLWSSFGDHGYAMGIARSGSGTVLGPWIQEPEPLWSTDGGHGMIGRNLDGGLFLTLHQPNKSPNERAAFFPLRELEDTVVLGSEGTASVSPIDRQALVQRHNVRQQHLDPRSPVSVGNGEFAFTMDLTGLQSLPDAYPVGARDDLPPGTLLGTQAQWGWHSVPPEQPYDLAGSTVLYASPRGPVPYVDMVGEIVNDRETDTSQAETWLRANSHRLDLGRIGFHWLENGTERPLTTADIDDTEQTLDLWTGVVTSRFAIAGHPVTVTTACHPDRDELAVRVESPALAAGLVVGIGFPYGSEAWHDAADWNSPEAHTTSLGAPEASVTYPGARAWTTHRELDESRYQVRITGQQLSVEQTDQHMLRIEPSGTVSPASASVLDFSVAFLSSGDGDCLPRGDHSAADPAPDARRHAGGGSGVVLSPADAVAAASAAYWPRFWSSGGAIELDATDDARAKELERRIVLSQYLTAINCSGSLPPQETGLVCNSWRGRFHLEMHWWHAAHFAQWNRVELLLPSLRWYSTVLETSRQTAKAQGFDGVRWPKQVGPDGRESPSPIGTFLIWQQPHPIYLAELVYRANPSQAVLEQFAEIVFDSAAFMASFAHPTSRGFELGPPLIPAQESYGSIRATVTNPTFELAYWQWALRTAAAWRERLGLAPVEEWSEVAEGMVSPRVMDGVYAAIDVEPFTIRTDHPSMLCALGVLPQTDLIDPDIMRATLSDVLADWDWASTWGWDYPVMAMTAARLGDPEAAVDALLLSAGKNTFLANGHNRQTDSLPLYLPGNGGLLAAVALMAAGWDNGPERHAPGFPAGWTVAWEGLVQAP
ncbi:Glycosyl hydrolases family 43 [Arthrobacter sp. yr096]|uniref:family 43 glycosylhydrolase n=1 Tax=Arthrobacter sp. yr096 TaxID=1761750 RepID=UPI0008D730C8|nr:family 43 glycosylhydrolase [Arthrobacter sp. yr096]SEI74354.1 Glycosyl hydrolases family 43 [Arthrobacter sp. yr096]